MLHSTLFTGITAIGHLRRFLFAALLIGTFGLFSGGGALADAENTFPQYEMLSDGENPQEDKEKEDGDVPLLDWLSDIFVG